jgi:hypothetical protein
MHQPPKTKGSIKEVLPQAVREENGDWTRVVNEDYALYYRPREKEAGFAFIAVYATLYKSIAIFDDTWTEVEVVCHGTANHLGTRYVCFGAGGSLGKKSFHSLEKLFHMIRIVEDRFCPNVNING